MALPAPDVPADRSVPVGPTAEEWRAMSADARERFVDRVNDALSDPRIARTEGRPHQKAKARIVDLLGLHFKAMGRTISPRSSRSCTRARRPRGRGRARPRVRGCGDLAAVARPRGDHDERHGHPVTRPD